MLNFENRRRIEEASPVQIHKDVFNELLITIDGVSIAIDHWNPDANLIFISHAHMDHIPRLPEHFINQDKDHKNSPKFICSKITKEIAKSRTNGKFDFPKELWVLGNDDLDVQSISFKEIKLTLFKSGHTNGSNSLYINGSETVLYTGDFITENRIFQNSNEVLLGLNPIKCDHLIIECTFGSPCYNFPPFTQLQEKLIEYIETQNSSNNPIIVLAYAFGKSQIIHKILNEAHEIILDKNIAKNTVILEQNGIVFPKWVPYSKYNVKRLLNKKNYVLIIPPYSMFQPPYNKLIASGAKVVCVSGKVVKKSYREEFLADYYLPLSDHCDFKELNEFIEKCSPQKIYLMHGQIEKLSYYLSVNFKIKNVFYF